MAPSAITEDYYMILEVDQTAGLELIIKSYRQLALKLHPDRNPSRDATAKFQRVRQIQTCAHHCVDHGEI
jgi:DnaJ-class molecular chaperone